MAKHGKKKTGERGILSLFLVFLLCFLVFSILFAFVAQTTGDPLRALPWCATLTLVLSGFFGGWIAARQRKNDRAASALFTGSSLAVVILIAAFATGGHVGGNTLLFLLGYLSALALGVFAGTRGKRRFRKGAR